MYFSPAETHFCGPRIQSRGRRKAGTSFGRRTKVKEGKGPESRNGWGNEDEWAEEVGQRPCDCFRLCGNPIYRETYPSVFRGYSFI